MELGERYNAIEDHSKLINARNSLESESVYGNYMTIDEDGHSMKNVLVPEGEQASVEVPPSSLHKVRDTLRFVFSTSLLKAIPPYRGLIFIALLKACVVILMVVSSKWLTLLCDVHHSIPRTFAWELVIKFLGSSYEDCLDHSNPDEPLLMTVNDWTSCSFSFTFPWIPFVGSLIAILTILLVAVEFVLLLVLNKSARYCIYFMITFLCPLECAYFGFSMSHVYKTVGMSSSETNGADWVYLRQRMWATISNPKEQTPGFIHPSWETSQMLFKCCGVSGISDWDFRIFRTGDPRLPKSCCNTDVDKNVNTCQFRFPTRYEVWNQGCLNPELRTARMYRNEQIVLLILNNFATLAILAFSIQLAIFMETRNSVLVPENLRNLLERTFGKMTKSSNKDDVHDDQDAILTQFSFNSRRETLV